MEPDKTWDAELKEKYKERFHAEYDIDEYRKAAKDRLPENHDWRKVGPHAVCFSCNAQHSYWIGPLKKLDKDKDGNYVISNIIFDAHQ